MKTIEFIYQDTEIHFALQNEGNVMVNATEMAKAFNKRVDDFTRLRSTESFINEVLEDLNLENNHAHLRDYKREDVISSNKKRGTYMCDVLALKFAAWLDVKFELWVYKTINNILFGHYKEHWEAHLEQTKAEKVMEDLKPKLLTAPTPEMMLEYFDAERTIKNAKSLKRKAITNQYKMDI